MSDPAARLRAVMDAILDGERPRPLPAGVLAEEFRDLAGEHQAFANAAVILYRGRAWTYNDEWNEVADRMIINLPALGDARQGPEGPERLMQVVHDP